MTTDISQISKPIPLYPNTFTPRAGEKYINTANGEVVTVEHSGETVTCFINSKGGKRNTYTVIFKSKYIPAPAPRYVLRSREVQ